jgi:hypothetical protein
MVWMEMIRLRTTTAHMREVDSLLFEATRHAEGDEGLIRLRIYRSASLLTDIAVSLVWDTSPGAAAGSRAGLSISTALKSFGLVDHSVWIEKTAPE